MNSFIFGGDTGETAESLQRKRAINEALTRQTSAPKNLGEGLAAIGRALSGRWGAENLRDEMERGRKDLFASTPAQVSPVVSALATPGGSGAVVPNDDNAMPGQVGMNMALADASQDFIQDNPGTYMSSGVRSTADQARLYADRENNPNPVAVPGTSRHERGLAIDIGGMTPDQRSMLPQYGLAQPVANDPPHVELAGPTKVASLDPSAGVTAALARPQATQPQTVADALAKPPQAVQPQQQVAQAAQGYSVEQLAKIAGSPYATASEHAIATMMLKQKLEEQDPAHALDIQSKRLAIRKAERDLDKPDLEWKPVGRDANGNWSYGWVNSKTQEVTGRDGKPFGQNAQPAEDATAGLAGEDYLKAIPRDRADVARKVANGEIDVSSLPNRGNYRMQVLSDAARFDPTFNPIDYKTRLATRKDFTSGKSAQNITSFNTAIGHLDSLDQSIDKLGNRGSSWYNSATAPISGQVDQNYQTALKEFRTSKQAVIDELTRAFRGSGGNVHDLVEWEKTINETESPAALHAATRQAIELLRSRIEAVGDQYNRGMGKKTDPVELLSPKARKAMERLEGTGSAQPNDTSPSANSIDPAALAEARRRGLIK